MNEPVLGAVKDLAKAPAADLYVSAKNWFASIDPSGKKLADYRDGVRAALSQIQIMGMSSPRQLNSLYIALRALPSQRKFLSGQEVTRPTINAMKALSENRSIEADDHEAEIDQLIADLDWVEDNIPELSRDYMTDALARGARKFDDDIMELPDAAEGPTQTPTLHGTTAIKLVQKHKRLLVLGHPGSGKTTFLKYLALAYTGFVPVPEHLKPLLPIYIPLREANRVNNPTPGAAWLRDLALSCASDFTEKPLSKAWLDKQLENGRCAVLLDGIDEIPGELSGAVIQSVTAFAAKYRSNVIVTTCRVGAFDRPIPGFSVCEVDEFNEDDIFAFVSHWFGGRQSKATQLLEHVAASTSARDLCRTPLLLTLLCIMYDYGGTIPRNRAELYENCIDALMFRWDASRAIERHSSTKGISAQRKKMMLSKIARGTFDSNVLLMKRGDLLKRFDAEIRLLSLRGVTSDVLLKDFEAHSGLLVERAVGVYGFSHLTFHEFLTMIAYNEESDQKELFYQAVEDPRYREVFLMLMERTYAPDKLALALASHAKHTYLDSGRGSKYISGLISDVLRADIALHRKVRSLLKEMEINLTLVSSD